MHPGPNLRKNNANNPVTTLLQPPTSIFCETALASAKLLPNQRSSFKSSQRPRLLYELHHISPLNTLLPPFHSQLQKTNLHRPTISIPEFDLQLPIYMDQQHIHPLHKPRNTPTTPLTHFQPVPRPVKILHPSPRCHGPNLHTCFKDQNNPTASICTKLQPRDTRVLTCNHNAKPPTTSSHKEFNLQTPNCHNYHSSSDHSNQIKFLHYHHLSLIHNLQTRPNSPPNRLLHSNRIRIVKTRRVENR